MTDGSILPSAPETVPARSYSRERVVILTLLIVLTAFRCAVFVIFEGSDFDSDQALLGLMAKHLIEGRAVPVFTYMQPYMLGVEAWLAAPFMLIGGVTVPMLKLPLLCLNVVISVLLFRTLDRWSGLRPALAAIPALFFVLVAPGTSAVLLETSGGNVAPFLIVVLLWMARQKPLVFGAVLAFGVLQREFAIYALGAFVALRLIDGSFRHAANWRPVGLGALSFGAVWQGVYLAKQFSSIDGPGTYAGWSLAGAGANVSALLDRVCIDTGQLVHGVQAVLTSHLGAVMGATQRPVTDFGINSVLSQGTWGMWPLVGGSLVLMLFRLGWLMYRQGPRPWQPQLEFATYLFLVGLQSLIIYALLRCGVIAIGTMRYALLGLFVGVGIVTAFLRIEPSKFLRGVAVGVVLVWATFTAADHARLAWQYTFDRPVNGRRLLADRLVKEGVKFAYGDFWDSLSIAYLTNEQVIVASTSVVFLEEYQWLVKARAEEAVWIKREPCSDGITVVEGLYICPSP
jgi:hypothetical protein